MAVAAQLVAVAQHEKLADGGAGEHHADQDQPVVFVAVGEAVVVAEHGKQHRQREVGVVHAALLAALAVDGVDRRPALRSATTVRWPGMIQKNTLALMAVAIMAPTSRKAARPANSWVAA
jgi:hypothetical protein